MEIQNILNDMCGVGEDKDYILKMFKKLEAENKILKEENEKLKELDREKAMNKCHVEKINKLQDVLYHKFDKQSCCECENWFDSDEIEEVNDSDYEAIDVCVECRDDGYSQCDECMKYCCDSLMYVVDGRDICSQCDDD